MVSFGGGPHAIGQAANLASPPTAEYRWNLKINIKMNELFLETNHIIQSEIFTLNKYSCEI